MRAIEPTRQFRRDYKREKRGQLGPQLDTLLATVLDALAADEPLATKHRDHGMTGEWRDCRDCHVRPDLVLIHILLPATFFLESVTYSLMVASSQTHPAFCLASD